MALLVCFFVGCSTKPTCSHEWTKATCSSAGTCKLCGEEKQGAAGHVWLEPTCTLPKRCSVCTLTVDSALGHDYSDGLDCVRCGETNPEYVQHFTYKLNSDSMGYVLYSCGNFKGDTVNIPSMYNDKPIMGIYQNAFKGKTNIKTVYIGDYVQAIGPSVFEGCTNLKTVQLSEESQLRTIYSRAFALCENLEEINLPDNLLSIYSEAFAGCSSLKKVKLGLSLLSIQEDTFVSCHALDLVEFNGTKEQWTQNFATGSIILPYKVREIKCIDGIYHI